MTDARAPAASTATAEAPALLKEDLACAVLVSLGMPFEKASETFNIRKSLDCDEDLNFVVSMPQHADPDVDELLTDLLLETARQPGSETATTDDDQSQGDSASDAASDEEEQEANDQSRGYLLAQLVSKGYDFLASLYALTATRYRSVDRALEYLEDSGSVSESENSLPTSRATVVHVPTMASTPRSPLVPSTPASSTPRPTPTPTPRPAPPRGGGSLTRHTTEGAPASMCQRIKMALRPFALGALPSPAGGLAVLPTERKRRRASDVSTPPSAVAPDGDHHGVLDHSAVRVAASLATLLSGRSTAVDGKGQQMEGSVTTSGGLRGSFAEVKSGDGGVCPLACRLLRDAARAQDHVVKKDPVLAKADQPTVAFAVVALDPSEREPLIAAPASLARACVAHADDTATAAAARKPDGTMVSVAVAGDGTGVVHDGLTMHRLCPAAMAAAMRAAEVLPLSTPDHVVVLNPRPKEISLPRAEKKGASAGAAARGATKSPERVRHGPSAVIPQEPSREVLPPSKPAEVPREVGGAKPVPVPTPRPTPRPVPPGPSDPALVVKTTTAPEGEGAVPPRDEADASAEALSRSPQSDRADRVSRSPSKGEEALGRSASEARKAAIDETTEPAERVVDSAHTSPSISSLHSSPTLPPLVSPPLSPDGALREPLSDAVVARALGVESRSSALARALGVAENALFAAEKEKEGESVLRTLQEAPAVPAEDGAAAASFKTLPAVGLVAVTPTTVPTPPLPSAGPKKPTKLPPKLVIPGISAARPVLSAPAPKTSPEQADGPEGASVEDLSATAPAIVTDPNELDGVFDKDNDILYHKYGITVGQEAGAPSFSLVSANVSPELLRKLEQRSHSVYLQGVASDEIEELGEELGRGSFGTVRKVLHKPTNRILAVKNIPLKDDPLYRKTVARELRLIQRCNSPYIVKFRGAFFKAGLVTICMEYMNAGSLRDLYRYGGAMDEPAVRLVALSVMRAMDYLREKGIMHRDIKADNILMNFNADIKLGDLGIGVMLQDNTAESAVGTQVYLAPERFSGREQDGMHYTVKADVWSLGITLVELGVGRYPFPVRTDDTPLKVGAPVPRVGVFDYARYLEEGEPIPNLPSDRFSPDCIDFISKCLTKDATNRPNPQDLLKHPWLASCDVKALKCFMSEYAKKTLAARFAAVEKDRQEHPERYVDEPRESPCIPVSKVPMALFQPRPRPQLSLSCNDDRPGPRRTRRCSRMARAKKRDSAILQRGRGLSDAGASERCAGGGRRITRYLSEDGSGRVGLGTGAAGEGGTRDTMDASSDLDRAKSQDGTVSKGRVSDMQDTQNAQSGSTGSSPALATRSV